MLRIGYLDEAVPAELLDARVEALARIIASNAPIAVRGMKRAQRDRAQQSQPTAATALVKFLTAPAAAPIITKHGLEPG